MFFDHFINFFHQANGFLHDKAGIIFHFPSYQIQPGETCHEYTNQDYPEYCGFSLKQNNPYFSIGVSSRLFCGGTILPDLAAPRNLILMSICYQIFEPSFHFLRKKSAF
jgi:hypothetical protein